MEDYNRWITQLKQNKCLPIKELELLCNKAKEVLSQEPNVAMVRSPVTVCGDIHGQLWDLLELFKICGEPPVPPSPDPLVHQLPVHGRLRGQRNQLSGVFRASTGPQGPLQRQNDHSQRQPRVLRD